MKIENGLPLDEYMSGKTIVPDLEVADLDIDASTAKRFDHSATPFIDVCEDAATVLCNHPSECEQESAMSVNMRLTSNHLSTERRKMA